MEKWLRSIKENDYLKIKALIKEYADELNSCFNDHGESILALAIRYRCDDEILELLVKSGADIYRVDDEGVGILDFAATHNNFFMVKYLVEQGFDVNKTKRKSGFTPLMCAICYDNPQMATLLLDLGADINGVDSKGFSAYMFANKMKKKNMIKLLEEY